MKKVTKFLSAVLVLAMIISLVPAASANAAKDYLFYTASGKKKEVSESKTLTIWVGGKSVNLDYMINGKTSGISGKFKSSKPGVVSVTQKGVIKAKKNGTAVITFTAANKKTVKAKIYARTRATALNVNVNGELKNGQTIELTTGKLANVTIDLPVNAAASNAGCASSYKVYSEVENSGVVSVLKNSEKSFTVNALAEGVTKITFVSNYTKQENVRKNNYYKENFIFVKVSAEQKEEVVEETAKQTAVNQITITGKDFTNVASDYVVKKDSVPVQIATAAVAADGKSVVLTTTSTNPLAGDYTVTLKSGKVLSFKMAASGPAKIEFGKAATIVTGNSKQAKVTYKILDQFGQDVTSKYAASAQISVSGGTVDKSKAGIVTVTSTTDFIANQTPIVATIVVVSGVNTASGSQQYTVAAAASPTTAKILGFYKVDGSNYVATSLAEGSVTAGQYYLGVEVRDQYGDLLPAASISKSNVVVTVAGSVTLLTCDTDKPIALKNNGAEFAAGYAVNAGTIKAGSLPVSVIPISLYGSTKSVSETLTVGETTKVKTLDGISPLGTIKIGSKVEFSYVAYDNAGNQITSYELLKEVNFSMSSGITMKFEKQSNGSAKLYGTPSSQVVVIYAQAPVYGPDSIKTFQYMAEAKSVPTSLGGFTKDASLGAVVGGTIQVPLKYLKVFDQYSDLMTPEEVIASGYGFSFEFGANTDAVANAGCVAKPANANTALINAAALKSGSNTVTVFLTNGGSVITGSDCRVILYAAAVKDLSNFTVEYPDLVYANGTKSDLAIDVYGKMTSTDIKIKLRPTDYEVILNPGKTAGTVENPGNDGKSGDNEFSVKYMVTVPGASGDNLKEFTINYSEKARTASTCELKADAHLSNNVTYTKTQIISMFDFKDQYGDAISFTDGKVTVTGYTDKATISGNGTDSLMIKDADVTLNIYFTNGSQQFTRTIKVY